MAWDADAAAAELHRALAVLATAQKEGWPSPAQRNVLAVMKTQVETYHSEENALLFGADLWIAGHVNRWHGLHEAMIRAR